MGWSCWMALKTSSGFLSGSICRAARAKTSCWRRKFARADFQQALRRGAHQFAVLEQFHILVPAQRVAVVGLGQFLLLEPGRVAAKFFNGALVGRLELVPSVCRP